MPGATGRRANADGPPNHTKFLERFAAKEAQRRVPKPTPLSAEEHAANRKRLSKVCFVKPKYSHETMINVAGILRKWQRYCDEKKVGDWEETIKSLSRELTMDFFLFVCGNYKVKSWGTSEEYIRQFQQLYTTVNGQYMNRNDSKEVYKYHHNVLVPKFGLRAPNIDGKPVLNVNSLGALLTFNIAYDSCTFDLERHRLQLAGCYQIMCYTGARPAELVDGERKKPKDGSIEKLFGQKVVQSADDGTDDTINTLDDESQKINELLCMETTKRGRPKALCYEDILMMLVRHPPTGRPVLAMAIKFIHHKGADNKPKPTIFFFTPSRKLICCPISLILALALHDHAFDAPSLTSASRVFESQVWGPIECTPLRWKEDMLKVPVFRRIRGGELSANEPMPYSKLNYDMGRQSLDSGHEKAFTPKFARRGAANAANGDAPDSVRDQMMRHDPRFSTFFSAYLNEIANFDLQNAFLEEPKQDQLFRMFAHVSLTRDPRATRDMVPEEVWAQVPPDPEIMGLENERALLKKGQYRIAGCENEEKIRKLTEKIRTKKAERDKRIVKYYREYYFYNRPTWDIEAQARGESQVQYEEPTIDLAIYERARLAEILCYQSKDLTEEQILCRRIEVVDLMVALCDKRDTGKVGQSRSKPSVQSVVQQFVKEESPAWCEVDDFPLLMDASQCPDCIGDERLTAAERTFQWCRPTIRNDHFDDQHLADREDIARRGEALICKHPKCKNETFKHLDHFRNHVRSVHSVLLRTSEQVNRRRTRQEQRRQMAREAKAQRQHGVHRTNMAN
ncbi:FluG domain-containing protein [Pochonia chlamydosporia 170]|uniref:FluG domain-containing protein n=1 Tax=Pochonia chlamydosporia 170 TaxID=1380566 RepID=A0A179F2R8_METCM|nr:FluG domain-containing protein [Pochonia chlamydosporia 170]OAQ59732.1 FluG domain-containing protein [Pochonia chlamydosporia 170]